MPIIFLGCRASRPKKRAWAPADASSVAVFGRTRKTGASRLSVSCQRERRCGVVYSARTTKVDGIHGIQDLPPGMPGGRCYTGPAKLQVLSGIDLKRARGALWPTRPAAISADRHEDRALPVPGAHARAFVKWLRRRNRPQLRWRRR